MLEGWRRWASVAAAPALVLGLAGCGDDDPGAAPSERPAPSGSTASTTTTSSLPATTTSTPSSSTTTVPPLPAYAASVEPVTAAELGASWRPGCPLEPESLRRITVSVVGFDGRASTGIAEVHVDHAQGLIEVFRRLYEARYPIERMEPISKYGGDDNASMAVNNTSAFNCRAVTGGTSWSQHSFGWALDLNPIQNPYVTDTTVLPPAGTAHVDRSPAPGRITDGDVVVQAFTAIGWGWGGHWSSLKDYQHFSATGD